MDIRLGESTVDPPHLETLKALITNIKKHN